MTLVNSVPFISVTAGAIDTFEDCAARYVHGEQRHPDGLLRTDPVPSQVSLVVHEALMEYCRQVEVRLRVVEPSSFDGWEALRHLVRKHLGKRGLDPRHPEVQGRLAKLAPGLAHASRLIVDDVPRWAVDPGRPTNRLVWVEQSLNHGQGLRAVELRPGYLVRTRPDLVGLRPGPGGVLRAVVRDIKGRNAPVDPRTDVGILIRGIWALHEIRDPRCPWFLLRRSLEVDPNAVDLEVINLASDGDAFHDRATLSADELLAHRDRFVTVLDGMDLALNATSLDEVVASPGGLCHQWCPFLNRCAPGQDHVAKYVGEEELQARLAGG